MLTSLIFLGCEQPFDGRGSLDQKIIVYSILSTDRNIQFVRVDQSYMPQSFDATTYTEATFLTDVRVTITLVGSKTWLLRDTVLPRRDTLRYKNPIHAFAANLILGGGNSYRIDIVHPRLGTVASTVRVPYKPTLEVGYPSNNILSYPSSYSDTGNIVFKVTLGEIAFIGRMFVDYEVLVNGEWTSERVEIPERYQSSEVDDYAYVVYPKLVKPSSWYTVEVFKNKLYQMALTDIAYKKYRTNRIIFDRVVFKVLQVDPNLYRYMNPNDDPHSIRLDEPTFSNVKGGLGLVGAYSVDSLIHLLPENFPFNH